MKQTTQFGLLAAVLIGAAIAAVATPSEHQSASGRQAPEGVTEPAAEATATDPSAGDSISIQGQVREVIQVDHYTYLRVGNDGQPDAWAAVSASPKLKVGDSVHVARAQLMENFQSATLNRTFEAIYFGALDSPTATGNEPEEEVRPNSQPIGDAPAEGSSSINGPPHAQVHVEWGTIKAGSVAKAKGALGYTIADIYAKGASLAGKTIRLRGVVVRVTPNVMGKTFVHVRDGSGDRKTKDLDLTITTQSIPGLNETVLFEGRLEVAVDYGAGYKYPVILQDARVVNE